MTEAFSICKVRAVHEGKNTVDVLRLDDGMLFQQVTLLCGLPQTTNTGTFDCPDPTSVDYSEEFKMTHDRDMLCVIMTVGGLMFVIGFFWPQICQMTFDRSNFRVQRHASDWYTTVNAQGDMEVSHPSGTFLRIGVSPDHEDLTGQDVDGLWKIEKNTDTNPHLRLVLANGGDTKLDLHADADGNVSLVGQGSLDANIKGDVSLETQGKLTATIQGDVGLTTQGKLDANATGDITVATQGQATVTSPSTVTVDAPLAHFTGDVQVDGNVSDATGSMQTMRDEYNVHEHPDGGPPDTLMD